MSTLSFNLRAAPTQVLDLSALIPSKLASLSLGDIARGMNDYFQSRKIAASSISCLYYLALAILLTIMTVQLWPD